MQAQVNFVHGNFSDWVDVANEDARDVSIHELAPRIRLGREIWLVQAFQLLRQRGWNVRLSGDFDATPLHSSIQRLRNAVNLAFSRDIFRRITRGNAEIHAGLIREGYLGYNPDLTPYPYDPDRARQLVKEAGYQNGLKIKIILPLVSSKIGNVLKGMFHEIGMEATIQSLGIKHFVKKWQLEVLDRPVEALDWDIALVKPSSLTDHPFVDLYRLYFNKEGRFRWITVDPDLQSLMNEFLNELDETKKDMLLQACERVIHEKALVMPLYSVPNLYTFNKKVGLTASMVNDQNFLKAVQPTPGHWSLKE